MPTRVTEEFIVFVIDSHASPKDQRAGFNICIEIKTITDELAVVGLPIPSKESTGKTWSFTNTMESNSILFILLKIWQISPSMLDQIPFLF